MRSRWFRPVLSVACGMAIVVASLANAPARQDARPNVVLILADDLGYGDLSSYGAEDLHTPHLDALVAAGVRFDGFYANSPVCSPTRAALLSGRYPDLVGVPGVIRTHQENSWGYLSPDAVLLPQQLKRAGYDTAMVGKWHLGLQPPNTPLARGFDQGYAFLGDMMDDYYTHRRHGINYMRRGDVEIDPKGHATDLFTREAVDYIRGRASASRPFFLYLAYNAPHVPLQPSQTWLDRVRARAPGMDDKRARHAALIEQMDDGIGQVVRALRDAGHYEKTLVVFTSDNGGQSDAGARNGPWRGGKTQVYEGGIRVPAAAVWPGHIRAGGRIETSLLAMDIYPTVAQAAGADIDHPIDARSFLPLLLGDEQAPWPPRTLFWVRREGGRRDMGLTMYAVRRGDWKLLQPGMLAPFELYNLREDPREQHDLASSRPDVFDELAAAFRAHLQRSGRVPWQPPRE